MHIEYAAYFSAACLIWSRVAKWWGLIVKIATPLIQAAEEMSKDGKVDKADRKKLVMMAIDQLQGLGKIRLNPLTRFIVGKIVDRIAAKLPDFTVSTTAVEILTYVSHK